GNDVHVAVAQILGRLADAGNERLIESDRIEVADRLDRAADAERSANPRRLGLDAGAHRVELLLLGRADVDGEDDLAREDVPRIGREENLADAADGARLVLHRDPL